MTSSTGSSIQYDYIIAGAGCAGLSLAVHMIHSGKFPDKKILFIDKHPKKFNDRTWCFWENQPTIFDPIVIWSGASYGTMEIIFQGGLISAPTVIK
jgi:hypothetical protein